MSRKSRAKPPSPFCYFNSSPEVIRLVVMIYVRFPLSLRNAEDQLFERSIDIIQNLDKTITTIPTHRLISASFRN